MRVLLLSPPLNSLTHPYSSLPSLTGFLRERSHDVTQCDMGMEVMDSLLSREGMAELQQMLAQKATGLSSLPDGTEKKRRLQEALLYAESVTQTIEEAKSIFRSRTRFFEPKEYSWANQILSRALDLISALYYPIRFQNEIMLTGIIPTFANIASFVENPVRNPFYDGMRKILSRLLVAGTPEIVGISLTYRWQYPFGFSLARMVREMAPGALILFGGTAISIAEDVLRRKPLESFRWGDGYVFGEGEGPLANLLDILERPREVTEIHANLFLDPSGEVLASIPDNLPSISPPPNPNSFATPDYSGLDLKAYLAPDTLFILTNGRGCYYGKCAFCAYGYGHNKQFVIKSREKIEEDLRRLQQRHEVRYISFADDCVPPQRCREIADHLLDSGSELYWACVLRFDQGVSEEVVEKMALSGCRLADIGNESGSPEVLALMRKGIDPQTRNILLRRLAAAGIGIHLTNFIGFPGETEKQAYETVRFLLAQQEAVSSVALGKFAVTHGSPVARKPEVFGLTSLERRNPDSLYPEYRYQVSSGLQAEEVSALSDRLDGFLCLGFPGSVFFIDTPSGAHNLFYLAHHGLDWMRKNLRNDSFDTGVGVEEEGCVYWAEGVRWISYGTGNASIFHAPSGRLRRLEGAGELCALIDHGYRYVKSDSDQEQKKRFNDLASLVREGFLSVRDNSSSAEKCT